MRKILKNIIFAGAFIFFLASPIATVAVPQITSAQSATRNCEAFLLGVIPPWYRGLTNPSDCSIKGPDGTKDGLSTFIWTIVLNVIQIALVLTSLIAFFFIMYGGFLFLTGGSIPSQIEQGRKTILNAVIGLVISIGAVAVTNLIFGVFNNAAKDDTYGVRIIQGSDLLVSILNLTYYIAGIVAVIVIIVAGLNYITSQGDSGRVTKAKNMILYAVIGIVVLIVAYAITHFVVGTFQ